MIELNSQKTCATTLDEFGLRFWPPLYMQRYMIVQEILEHPIWNGSIKKVVDFGCSELGLFKCIKPVPGLNTIMLVDIDYSLLDLNQTKVMPTTYDHVSMHERKEPLTVDIYNGSIADLDDRMLGVDAVICIELIEHLHSDVLNRIPNTVFEFIKPMLAIFTTPNVEFNVLFPNFHTQFRNEDHKFEWTRKEFKKWARKITTCYPDYAVQFDGIGVSPSGTEKFGCCSQMAIFYRKDMKTSPAKPIGCRPYKLLRRVDYPYQVDNENDIREQTIKDKITEFVTKARSNYEFSKNGIMKIPLKVMLPYISDCCSSIEELEEFVSKLYRTKKNDQGESFLVTDAQNISSDEYKSDSDEYKSDSDSYESDSDSYSNHSGQYSLLENIENKDIDSNEMGNMSFSESTMYTPMTDRREPNVCFSNIDSFNTMFSSSELYKTAVDHDISGNNDIEISSNHNGSIIVDNREMYQDSIMGHNNSTMNNNGDMEISSSCNGSIIVDSCKMYQEFVTGRNSSTIGDEDIRETETTLTGISNCDNTKFFDDVENDDVINDNTIVIQKDSNAIKKGSSTSGTVLEVKSKQYNNVSNLNEENIKFEQPSVFLHRSLLDVNDLTERLLSIPDKDL